MKRDMDLVRKILLSVESAYPERNFNNYDVNTVMYHKALVVEAGLVHGSVLNGVTEIPASVMLMRLTWDGHDFIDGIASEKNWRKVKSFLNDAGKQITIETIKFAVKQLFGCPI